MPPKHGRVCLICSTNIDGSHHNTKVCSDLCREKQNKKIAAQSKHRNRDKIAARDRKRREKNREMLRKKSNAYYWANRDEILKRDKKRRDDPLVKEAARKRRQENKGEISRKKKIWYSANLERERARSRVYRKNNKEAVKNSARVHRIRLTASYGLLKDMGLLNSINIKDMCDEARETA